MNAEKTANALKSRTAETQNAQKSIVVVAERNASAVQMPSATLKSAKIWNAAEIAETTANALKSRTAEMKNVQ